MNKPASLIVCLLLITCAFPTPAEYGETTMLSNVSYSSVTALEFTPASEKLVYGDDNPDLQYGLLWLPDNPASDQPAPLVVLVHGGCWLNAYDIQHTFPLSSALAEAGYAVWSLEYRRSGDEGGGWPGSFEDIRQGLAFTSTLNAYPVDLERMVIMGHSAGGHLALLTASGNPHIEAVIGLAAITDIVEYSRGQNNCQTATIDFMAGVAVLNVGHRHPHRTEAYIAANPVGKPVHARTLLLQGDIDSIVPLEQSQLQGATPVVLEGAGHFDWVHPGTAAYQLLLSTLEKTFRH